MVVAAICALRPECSCVQLSNVWVPAVKALGVSWVLFHEHLISQPTVYASAASAASGMLRWRTPREAVAAYMDESCSASLGSASRQAVHQNPVLRTIASAPQPYSRSRSLFMPFAAHSARVLEGRSPHSTLRGRLLRIQTQLVLPSTLFPMCVCFRTFTPHPTASAGPWKLRALYNMPPAEVLFPRSDVAVAC